MPNKMLDSVGVRGGGRASGSKDEGIRVAYQKKVTVGRSSVAAGDSVAGLLPAGLPASVRQKVCRAVSDCVSQVVSAMLAARVLVGAVTSGVNRVVQNGNDYMLWTANGMFIPIKNCPQNRPWLMLMANRYQSVPPGALVNAEKLGHWRLGSEDRKWNTDPDNGEGQAQGDDDGQVSYDDDLHSGTTDLGESIDPRAKAEYKRRLEEIRDERKKAEAEEDEDRLTDLDAEAASIKREILKRTTRTGRIRHDHTPNDAKVIHRMEVYLARTFQLIGKKDPELAKHLKVAVTRNGVFRYDGDPAVQWEVCGRISTSVCDESRAPVTAEG